jgi:D-glucosaminate-6-phosphate ammonia-lyase
MSSSLDRLRKVTRRTLFQRGGMLAAAGMLPAVRGAQAAPAVSGLQLGPNLYESIGVTPIVNCRGTFTIISGSQTLPEVKRAMDEASRHYVHLDELMAAVSKRLAELTKAEWGIVTAGCAAALTHATSACIAGTDPEKMQRVPKLEGLKNEVIIPVHSRNVYDHAVRMLGVNIVEVNSPQELEAAINPKTAMVMIMSSPRAESGPMSTENICKITRAKNIPVIVDAAAEVLTIPNKHLARGANMVAYSGGKCIRGPQSAGLLLGQKDLLEAAWANSAPHHAFGRSLKVGKEEIMGMLAAIETWVKRDQKAEWALWESWLNHIGEEATRVKGVTTEKIMPEDLSNHAPELRLKWDGTALGITGKEVEQVLLNGRPRIAIARSTGTRPDQMASSVTIMPYMMMPDDHKIAAQALYAVLSKPPKFENPVRPSGEPATINGEWTVRITYLRGTSDHHLSIQQSGHDLNGKHDSETLTGALRGSVYGNEARFHSSHKIQGTSIGYEFRGTVAGNSMNGTVNMGEYGQANWTATRA